MNFSVRPSGLAVPQEKPKPPERKYGLLEIQDAERRELARKALSDLWDAMNLTEWTQFEMPDGSGPRMHTAHHHLYRFVGETLLGPDCPEKEQWA